MNGVVNIIIALLNLLTVRLAKWAGKQWAIAAEARRQEKAMKQQHQNQNRSR